MRPPISPGRLRAPVILLTSLAIAALCGPPTAHAADFGAKTNGNWNSPTTWTPSGVPSLNDNVYIGSTFPTGAAATATILLTQNQQAEEVYLGYSAGRSGTLNLGNFNLTANRLYLGFNGGTGAITRGTGTLDVGRLQLSASNLLMRAGDRSEALILNDGSSVTTAATANTGSNVWVRSGSTLTLGAELSAGGSFFDNRYNIEISGENSALNAQGHKITAHTLSIGWEVLNNAFGIPTFRVPGNHVVQLLNRGDLVVDQFLFVANQNFNLTPTDQVWGFELANGSTNFGAAVGIARLSLSSGAIATTTEVGNITYGAFVNSGSTLTLGADLNVGKANGNEFISVAGNNSILDAQGHKITAWSLSVGYDVGTNALLLNRGDLDLVHLNVGNQDINLTAADQVTSFGLLNGSTNLIPAVGLQRLHLQEGAMATTSSVGNITGSLDVTAGSTLTLGADLSVSEYVQVFGANSTINAQGHNITALSLTLAGEGGDVQLQNKGSLTVTDLRVANQNLNLGAADRVTDFTLINGSSNLGAVAGIRSLYLFGGSTATTASAGNLTGSVDMSDGTTLTLGADLSVSGTVNANGSAVTINAQGHKITADTLTLGTDSRLVNKGSLAVTHLFLAGQTMGLSAADRVTNLTVGFSDLQPGGGSTVSTAATGNVTGSVIVSADSTLNLGADLAVTGDVRVGLVNSTLDARGRNITANNLSLEYSSATPGTPNIRLLNDGAVTVRDYLILSGGVQVELHDGNDTARGLQLSGGSDLRIKSAATGFTITGATADDLLIFDSTLTLELNGLQPGWVLRWANPAGGNHIADLNALIDQDMILFSATNGGQFNIVSQNGYTYIVQPVPEPGLILLVAAPITAVICRRRR